MTIRISSELEQTVREAYICSRGILSTCQAVLQEYYQVDMSLGALKGVFEKFDLREKKASGALMEVIGELCEKYGPVPEKIVRDIPRVILFYSLSAESIWSYLVKMGESPGSKVCNRSIGPIQKTEGRKPIKKYKGFQDPAPIGKHL
jgi:hypothetical protein